MPRVKRAPKKGLDRPFEMLYFDFKMITGGQAVPRKLILSEAFVEGTTKELVLTTRVPENLYLLVEEEAKRQGTSVAALTRGLISYHFIPEHFKKKLKKGSGLASNDLGLLENFRAHTQDLTRQLEEVDALRGVKKTLDPDLKTLVTQKVKEEFEKAWERVTTSRKK